MRILYLNPCGRMGGAETSLVDLLASVRAAEPTWELWLVLGEAGPLEAKAKAHGVQVIIAPFPESLARLGDTGAHPLTALWSSVKASGSAALYAKRLGDIIRAIRPHIIHTNGFKMHVLGIWTRPSQSSVVWHIHDYVRSRPLMGRLLRVHAACCTGAIANSKSVAADLKALLPKLKVVPVYNAVDLKRFAPDGPKVDLDEIAGLTSMADAVRVGLVATFARWKGHKVFLQALSQMSSRLPVRGYIIGGPIYQTNGSQWTLGELQHEADGLGLAGKVGFTGFLHDTSAAMRSLDIVVHASTEPEPFGMVIAEGMACGKAVVASQAGGASELFVDGEDALAHAPGDASALAAQIRRLVCDEGLRSRLGKSARTTAERLYCGTRLAKELLTFYRGVSDGSGEISTEQRDPKLKSVMHSSLRMRS